MGTIEERVAAAQAVRDSLVRMNGSMVKLREALANASEMGIEVMLHLVEKPAGAWYVTREDIAAKMTTEL